jgi:peptidyl-prolyl cis-trans isomerase C
MGLGALLSLLLVSWGCSKDEKPAPSEKEKEGAKTEKAERHKVPPCPEEDKGKIVATVDGIKIGKCELYDKLHKLSPYIRRRYTTVKRKKEFLERIIRFELLAEEARRRGFDKHPEVERAKKEVMVQKLTRKMFRKAFKPSDITEKELKEFYEKHKSDYNKPQMVRVSQIVVKTKPKAQDLVDRAKKLDARGFRKLAREMSIDEKTKMRGGDLRYFAKDTDRVAKPIVEAAFELEKRGDVAGPIKTDAGWHVIKLAGKRRPIKREFQQVRNLLRNRVLREKRSQAQKDFVEKLKKKTKPFEVHEKKLELVKICGSKKPGSRFPFRRGHPDKHRHQKATKKAKGTK